LSQSDWRVALLRDACHRLAADAYRLAESIAGVPLYDPALSIFLHEIDKLAATVGLVQGSVDAVRAKSAASQVPSAVPPTSAPAQGVQSQSANGSAPTSEQLKGKAPIGPVAVHKLLGGNSVRGEG
jgi:hypothetical protein